MPENLKRVWTIRELMKSAIDHLKQKGFEDVRLNVELLLAHALELQRIQLYVNFDKPLTEEELKRFRGLFERRLKREPVQYIIGSSSFMGLRFAVDSRVLIPRPETETLIEQVMLLCKRYSQNETISIFDIGTGSGNIAISIAKYVKHAHITTIDINNEALIIAKQNAVFHSVESRIQFSCTDIFNQSDELFKPRFDLLVSNPPYVPKDEWEQLQVEVRDYEPASALTDGLDGYKFHHRIIEIIPSILKPNGSVVLEVGYGQAEIVARELKEAGLEQLNITNDLQGIPRVVSGIWIVQPKIYISLN